MNITEKIKVIKDHLWTLVQERRMREEDYHDFATAIAERVVRLYPKVEEQIINNPDTDWKMLMDTQLDHILMDIALENAYETATGEMM